MSKKSFDISGLDSPPIDLTNLPDDLVSTEAKGAVNDILLEPVPKFIKTASETVYEGRNNSWIVLGRDRPSSKISGYGGKGHTQAGTIDLVVRKNGIISKR